MSTALCDFALYKLPRGLVSSWYILSLFSVSTSILVQSYHRTDNDKRKDIKSKKKRYRQRTQEFICEQRAEDIVGESHWSKELQSPVGCADTTLWEKWACQILQVPKNYGELEVHQFSRVALSSRLTLCTPNRRNASISLIILNIYYVLGIVLNALHLFAYRGTN